MSDSTINDTEEECTEVKPLVVYFSSVTENTHKFIQKTGLEAKRIPLKTKDETLLVKRPYVLVTPTYGGGRGEGAVPKQVIKFLNVKENRSLCIGVVASGNMNFYDGYLLAGKIIQNKLNVPFIDGFELMGMPGDHERIAKNIIDLFKKNYN